MSEISQTSTEVSSQANVGNEPRLPAGRQVYEVGFHIVPTVGEDGVPAVVDTIRKLLGSAEIISEGFPRKITLAYQVDLPAGRQGADAGKREKYTESYFGHIKFATVREALPELQAALSALQPVLRFLIIETVREEIVAAPRRAVFTSDRLEGKTIEKPVAETEQPAEVSEAELDKSIEALTG